MKISAIQRARLAGKRAYRYAGYAAVAVPFMIITLFAIFFAGRTSFSYEQIGYDTSRNRAIVVLPDGMEVGTDSISVIKFPRVGTITRLADNRLSYAAAGPGTIHNMINTVKVAHGSEYSLILSDKSNVWINSESEITFPVNFGSRVRQVGVAGEVFFDVESNPENPFIVTTRNAVFEVTGTQFNINSHDPDYVTATLLEGRLSVRSRITDQKMIILPSQTAMIDNFGHITVMQEETGRLTAWINGEFEFRNETLESIMDRLSKWYDIDTVTYESDYLRQVRYTGSIKRNLPLEKVIEILEITSVVNLKIGENNEVKISALEEKPQL